MKLYLLVTVSIISLLSPLEANADDDVKRLIGGVALGIVGQMLEGAEQEQQSTQNVQQTAQQSLKPKLQYDADVAEMQKHLKALGHYDGVVDGLKGGGTTSAIKAFEADKGYEIDGVLSKAERDVLTVSASQVAEKPTTPEEVQTTSQPPENASETQIQDIEELSAVNHTYNVCSNYRTLGHEYSYAVRDDLDSNYDKVSKVYKNRINKQAKCLGIDDVELLQRRSDKAYEESDDGKTVTIGIAGAIGGLNSPDSASEYCNMSSGMLLISSRKLEKEVFNKETCAYE